MNLESSSKKSKQPPVEDTSFDDFDFKPITSGLGFHNNKSPEMKPAFQEKALPTIHATPMNSNIQPARKEMNVYENDLSLFYGANKNQAPMGAPAAQPVMEEKQEKTYPLATRAQRVVAYIMDLAMVASVLGIVLTIMARTISMDLLEVWSAFPNEITPLVLVLFAGFYVIYFSVFEKGPGSTIGKSIFGLKVVTLSNEPQTFSALVLRSVITLANFLSLGLFAWFDLQNKVTNSKVIGTH
ncbi:MAG TPA: RDD family protein [Bacteriovoracaceae bacterium]|nr:RDD family protein [Bacteriovoracaceae bacterium]